MIYQRKSVEKTWKLPHFSLKHASPAYLIRSKVISQVEHVSLNVVARVPEISLLHLTDGTGRVRVQDWIMLNNSEGSICISYLYLFSSVLSCHVVTESKENLCVWVCGGVCFPLKCHYDENRIFSIEVILKHKQEACMRLKMLFSIFKHLVLFKRYLSF